MKRRARDRAGVITLHLSLDGASAAVLFDLCGQLSETLIREWGDAMEAHWLATEPSHPIYGPLQPPPKR